MFFLKIIDALLSEVANTLNDACSALPDPLGKSIQAGDLLKSMAVKLAKNASTAICVKLASKSTNALYDINGSLPPEDEWNVRRLRWSPIIKDEDDEEGLDEEDDDDKKLKSEGGIKKSDADGLDDNDKTNSNGGENDGNVMSSDEETPTPS